MTRAVRSAIANSTSGAAAPCAHCCATTPLDPAAGPGGRPAEAAACRADSMDTEWKPTGKARFVMATTWRCSGICIVFCMLAFTCAWGSPGDWMRIATKRSIAEYSHEQRAVLEWLYARTEPGRDSPGGNRLGLTRVSPGEPETSAVR